ncbi:MAG: sigma-54-dependent Fis family transcriptional regulator [Pirellulales bacterium]|nr:sigma-54-dependent Fis family transcriptional regulator [Pirellulales bacterium]
MAELPDSVLAFSGRLFRIARQSDAVEVFLSEALAACCTLTGATAGCVARAAKGTWSRLAEVGQRQDLSEELLAETLDRHELVREQGWVCLPLGSDRHTTEILAVCESEPTELPWVAVAESLAQALAAVRERQADQHRIRRLEAILEIAADWQQTREMDALLTQIAEASTRLLVAERASIFLWDRPRKTLVGKPALGVEGGQLEVSDDAGIVGQVLATGEPQRVDCDGNQQQVDRQVDRQLGFQTRSLLCVPLRGKGGRLLGVFEMINKQQGRFDDSDEEALTELASHAAIALETTRQHEQLVKTQNQMTDQAASQAQLIGACPAIEALRSTVQKVADTELAVLVLGENGTGKEVVSQQIHYLSRRRNAPFVAVNCAALSETLLESELFGHEKGAFTDAHEMREGKFELASGGTLFLDEIGDMTLNGQAKLLRVLEEKVVVRVGGSRPIHTDTRVIAATNQKLADMVREKRFREDLYFRLNVVTIEMPALRDRDADIVELAEYFLAEFCGQAGRAVPQISEAARRRLSEHAWPGNVRELRNLMERLAYLTAGERIAAEDLSFILSPAQEPGFLSLSGSLNDVTRQFQSEYIRQRIDAVRGNMTEAARQLGLHRSNLYRKMRQLGMESPE